MANSAKKKRIKTSLLECLGTSTGNGSFYLFFGTRRTQQKACVYRISMSVYNDSVLFLALPVCVRGLLRVGLLLPVLAQQCYLFIYIYCCLCFVFPLSLSLCSAKFERQERRWIEWNWAKCILLLIGSILLLITRMIITHLCINLEGIISYVTKKVFSAFLLSGGCCAGFVP